MNEFAFSSGDFHPGAAQALAETGLLDGVVTSDEIHPTAEQYQIVAGHHVVLAASNALMEQAFVLATVLDPSEHQDLFPDWIERIQKGFMLCKWMSHVDLDGDLGWYARGKMIPVNDEERDQIEAWLRSGKSNGELRPEFLFDRYQRYHDDHNALAPSEIAKSVTCGKCGSREVKIIFHHVVDVVADASELTIEGKQIFVATGHNAVTCHGKVTMICAKCHAKKELEAEEFKFEPDSIIGQIAQHPH